VATCPDCGGFLNSHHRCFGIWRYRARAGVVALVSALAGIGVATVTAPTHSLPVTGLAALLGAIVGSAVWRHMP
jgi:hypothetical protein